ncbi:unnamed protein product [marine sediment metagenome]|uniref:Uncharacterized protein n=1 Tax=marine sediment metagenome TaxID=412755 RepID=X1D8V4_9ZZZZ
MPVCDGCPEYKYLLTESGDPIALEDGCGCILLEDQDKGKASSPWKSKGSVFLLFAIGEFVRQLIRIANGLAI